MIVRQIRHHGSLYLTRVHLLKTRWLGVYLHVFHRPDPDRHLHNHPWDWVASLRLWGQYEERTTKGLDEIVSTHYPSRLWHKPGQVYHIISKLLSPRVVTLFFHGKKVRRWGFLNENNEHEPWDEYLLRKQICTPEEIAKIKQEHGDD